MLNESEQGIENPTLDDLPDRTKFVLEQIDAIECANESENKLKEAVKEMTIEALCEVTRKYGKNGEGAKPYHDGDHSVDIIADGLKIIEMYAEKYNSLNTRDKLLLVLALSHHDIVQEHNPAQEPGENEKDSAKYLEKAVRQKGLDKAGIVFDADLVVTNRIITATIFDFANHKQLLTNTEVKDATDVLERVGQIADIRDLGVWRRQHWRGNRLFWEIFGSKYEKAQFEDDPLIARFKLTEDWFENQIKFLGRQKIYLERFEDMGKQACPDIEQNKVLYEGLLAHLRALKRAYQDPEILKRGDFINREDMVNRFEYELRNILLTKDEKMAEHLKDQLGFDHLKPPSAN